MNIVCIKNSQNNNIQVETGLLPVMIILGIKS